MDALAPHTQFAPTATLDYVSKGLVREYVKGERIFHHGDQVTGLWAVTSGLVRLVHLTEEGREITVRLAGPGDLLEANFLSDEARCTADALCVTPHVTLSYTPRDTFSRSVPAALFNQVAQQFASAETRLAFLSCPVEMRVAWLFDWLAVRFGAARRDENGCSWRELGLPLTHEDVAAMVNATRVTVTYAFKQMRSEGRLVGSRGRYSVRVRIPEIDL